MAELTRLVHEDRQLDENVPYSEDDSAIGLLLGSFIWVDIVSCTWTLSGPLLEPYHKFVLERTGIRLENLTGCKNWAMIFVFEISVLDT